MLDAADVLALLAARHGDPFAVLGMHADASGAQCVRALLPGADAVELIDAADGTLGRRILRDGEDAAHGHCEKCERGPSAEPIPEHALIPFAILSHRR